MSALMVTRPSYAQLVTSLEAAVRALYVAKSFDVMEELGKVLDKARARQDEPIYVMHDEDNGAMKIALPDSLPPEVEVVLLEVADHEDPEKCDRWNAIELDPQYEVYEL